MLNLETVLCGKKDLKLLKQIEVFLKVSFIRCKQTCIDLQILFHFLKKFFKVDITCVYILLVSKFLLIISWELWCLNKNKWMTEILKLQALLRNISAPYISGSNFYFFHGMRKKCPNTEFILVRIFLYSDWIPIFTP